MSDRQHNLFDTLPPPAEKPLVFKVQRRPLWTEHKAKLIERYLYYFVLVTKHGAYIDGFAAAQDPQNSESWACRLVLKSQPQFLREFWLCDISDDGCATLREMASEIAAPKGRRVHIIRGDFNKKIDKILRHCKITEKTAAFCLLDQRAFECHWSTVRKLAEFKKEGPKIELFYFFASGWLDRSLAGTTKNIEQLRRWWGRSDWKALQGMDSWKRVLLFSDRLKKELGYAHAYPWPIFERGSRGRVMYHMVHATDHPAAPKLMNRAYTTATKAAEPIEQLEFELSALIKPHRGGHASTL
jgi:three-Cys-motif partner protein